MGNENSKNKEATKSGKINEKHKNGSVNGLSANITSNGLEIAVNGETMVQQNGEPVTLNLTTDSTEPEFIVVETDSKPAEAPVIPEVAEAVTQKEEVKESNEAPTDETANLKQESEASTGPESVTPDAGPEEVKAPETENGNSQRAAEDGNPEKNPVMNFFKTLMTPKIIKKEAATPDAAKDQSQKETQPAATTTVAQVSEPPAPPKGMNIPPPPPPEPPKMEIKGEPAAKPAKASPKEQPKAAAKTESPKVKSAKAALSNLFRPKVLLGFKAPKIKGASKSGAKAPAKTAAATIKDDPPQPEVAVEVTPVVDMQKVDPSKAGTLEAAAKPELPPPAEEEKKPTSKSLLSFFKPKADPKKATPAPAAAAAETAKAKEEPKAAAKSAEAAVDSKPASVAPPAADDASVPKKQEKRNSIQLFKFLSQKRNSTDAGVQTEPAVAAPAAEKAK
ncbi:breast carcinoma-amplified sequence 1 isoform X7 [Plectropomus leopardus]|uniref:breast carcinoma-amplified sequence 1 isoform X7 n=1 Tax=Plectropomus leopardus TaxID=160734 RepID=UPI001C4D4B85|nr:breast carcinoma-amplified sequence 1 isoform X7 [Plectropomus leopardus]